MSNFVTENNWIYQTNIQGTTDNRVTFLMVKKFFTDFASSGFEIVASSDTFTAGPGDRLNSVSDINYNSSAQGSWFVVTNNNHEKPLQILFKYVNVFSSDHGPSGVKMSVLGYEDLTNLNGPTAPDHNGSDIFSFSLRNSVSSQSNAVIFHYMRSDDGKLSRLFIHQNNVLKNWFVWDEVNIRGNESNKISYCFGSSPMSSYEHLLSNFYLHGNTNRSIKNNLGSEFVLDGTLENTINLWTTMGGGGYSMRKRVYEESYHDRSGNNMNNGVWDCSRIFIGEKSHLVGEIGTIPDLWVTGRDDTDPTTPAASGSMVCGAPINQGDREYVHLGFGLITPWNGTTPKVDSDTLTLKPAVSAFDISALSKKDEVVERKVLEVSELNPYRVVQNEPILENSGSVDRHRYQVRYPYNRGRRKPRGAKFIDG